MFDASMSLARRKKANRKKICHDEPNVPLVAVKGFHQRVTSFG
jgi:hypothetical protein